MPHVKGQPREESVLFPERIEDYVPGDSPVRFIDAFVDRLELAKLGFQHAVANDNGRPSFDPADLLKLYIYGYLNRRRSSRDLQQETHRNVEVMWLIRRLRPDFRTINNFRSHHSESLKKVFLEFQLICRELNLFSNLIGVDGSKFSGVNSKDNNYTEGKLKKLIEFYEKKIERYLEQMDKQDAVETDDEELTEEALKEKIELLRKKLEEKKELAEKLSHSDQSQISLTDPDCRRLHSGDGSIVGYNVQTAVDSKHHLIVDFEVTNALTDQNELANMSMKAKEVLQCESLQAMGDRGYYDSQQIKMCEDAGIEVFVDAPAKGHPSGLFSIDRFLYDSDRDVYVCPAGEELTNRGKKLDQGREVFWYETPACASCSIRHLCTNQKKRNRRVQRWVHQEILDRVKKRVALHPEMMTLRKSIVEHPFGTIKRGMNHHYFLLRGFRKVTGEFSLTALAYNIKRVLKILGFSTLMEKLPFLNLKNLINDHFDSTLGLFGLQSYQIRVKPCFAAR
jgi:transposase